MPVPYPRSPWAPWSNALIRQEIARRLAAQVGPQRADIVSRSKADIGAMQGVGATISEILKGVAPATRAGYASAAKDVAGFAGGFSSDMESRIKAAQQAGANFAASQGAPTSTPTIDPTKSGDTMYALEGFNPASGLEAQGAAAGAYADQLPGFQAAQTRDVTQQRMAQSEQELIDLAKKEPEMRQQIADELYKRELDKLNARLQVESSRRQDRAQTLYEQQFGEKVRHDTVAERQTARRIAIQQKNYQLQVQKHQDAMDKAAADGRKPDAALSGRYGYIVDTNGDPILDGQGNKIPIAAKSSGGKVTPAQQRTNVRMAGEAAKSMYESSQPTPNPNPLPGAKPGEPGGPIPAKHPMTFAQAQTYLMTTYGLARAKARKILVSAGWKPDGKRG